MGLLPKSSVQPDLFDEPNDRARCDARMLVMDQINKKLGRGSVMIVAVGVKQRLRSLALLGNRRSHFQPCSRATLLSRVKVRESSQQKFVFVVHIMLS